MVKVAFCGFWSGNHVFSGEGARELLTCLHSILLHWGFNALLHLCRIFGFVARKTGTSMDNICHLFAEHDPEQPASAIVNFVSKVMIGSQKSK